MVRRSRIMVALGLAFLLVFMNACTPAVSDREETVTESEPPLTEGEVVTPAPIEQEVNFRLLVSDEVNAIEDFDELNVTITSIGVQQGGESGGWTEYDLGDPGETVDLTELKGSNATEIWSGELDDGTYNKVFIYVSNVEGVLIDGEANVKLPSGKLQISKAFEVASGGVTEFVYDITVINTGKSDKYILKPQIAESGPDKDFNDVTAKGKPEDAGKPEDKGKPEDRDKPEGKGKPEGEESDVSVFEGTIDSMVSDNWTVTMEGEAKTVYVSEAEIEGDAAVGLEIVVKGALVDGIIVASYVEVREAEQEEPKEIIFEGTIDSMVSDNWTVAVEGEIKIVDVSEAEIEGEPAVGLEVVVKGISVDGIVAASEIDIKES